MQRGIERSRVDNELGGRIILQRADSQFDGAILGRRFANSPEAWPVMKSRLTG
jgi:hypothetical protein